MHPTTEEENPSFFSTFSSKTSHTRTPQNGHANINAHIMTTINLGSTLIRKIILIASKTSRVVSSKFTGRGRARRPALIKRKTKIYKTIARRIIKASARNLGAVLRTCKRAITRKWDLDIFTMLGTSLVPTCQIMCKAMHRRIT